ncbi:MAG: Fur family transcriptional regulator [Candidatus Brocadiia bacterium]
MGEPTPAYREVLRERGLSVTRLRLAIMEALHRGGSVATAAGLLEELRRQHDVHKTTVYRNLSALEEAGLLRRVPSEGRASCYELTCPHSLPVHPHFTCRSCGEVICLEPVDLTDVWEMLTGEHGVNVEQAEVTLTGLCAECRGSGD